MTVTLAPELAGLLERTGHGWPDADEDRIVAVAHGWGELAGHLDTVRADHGGAARSIQAHNSGVAVSAFGDWASALDGQLQQLVEACARAEAVLLAVARWVYETKTAILGELDDLAARIDRAERDVADVPLVSGLLASALDQTVGALVDGTRQVVGGILDRLADPVFNDAGPALVGCVEAVKSVVAGLRKLLKGEIGADWPTTPSGKPLPQNTPRGPPAKVEPKDSDTTKRAIGLENEAARALARAGYDVEQIPRRRDRKTPDYMIEGQRFDCYAPTAPSAWNIWTRAKREKIESGQTDRLIIDIDSPDAQVDVGALRRQFQDHPMPGLVEAKVIAPGGVIIDIYP